MCAPGRPQSPRVARVSANRRQGPQLNASRDGENHWAAYGASAPWHGAQVGSGESSSTSRMSRWPSTWAQSAPARRINPTMRGSGVRHGPACADSSVIPRMPHGRVAPARRPVPLWPVVSRTAASSPRARRCKRRCNFIVFPRSRPHFRPEPAMDPDGGVLAMEPLAAGVAARPSVGAGGERLAARETRVVASSGGRAPCGVERPAAAHPAEPGAAVAALAHDRGAAVCAEGWSAARVTDQDITVR